MTTMTAYAGTHRDPDRLSVLRAMGTTFVNDAWGSAYMRLLFFLRRRWTAKMTRWRGNRRVEAWT